MELSVTNGLPPSGNKIPAERKPYRGGPCLQWV